MEGREHLPETPPPVNIRRRGVNYTPQRKSERPKTVDAGASGDYFIVLRGDCEAVHNWWWKLTDQGERVVPQYFNVNGDTAEEIAMVMDRWTQIQSSAHRLCFFVVDSEGTIEKRFHENEIRLHVPSAEADDFVTTYLASRSSSSKRS
jgi:hypothetical protein